MPRVLKLTAALLILFTVYSAGAVFAQYQPPPPMPPGVSPHWTPAPGNSRVAYAPNIPGDLFWYGNHYYYFHRGYWFKSKSLYGAWRPVRKPPRGIYRVNRNAFKHGRPW